MGLNEIPGRDQVKESPLVEGLPPLSVSPHTVPLGVFGVTSSDPTPGVCHLALLSQKAFVSREPQMPGEPIPSTPRTLGH